MTELEIYGTADKITKNAYAKIDLEVRGQHVTTPINLETAIPRKKLVLSSLTCCVHPVLRVKHRLGR